MLQKVMRGLPHDQQQEQEKLGKQQQLGEEQQMGPETHGQCSSNNLWEEAFGARRAGAAAARRPS